VETCSYPVPELRCFYEWEGFGILGVMDKAAMREVRKKIGEAVEKIVREYKPEKIILFGSWAWGKPGPDSDVDLFIIKKSRRKRRDRAGEVWDILFPHELPMDVLVYTPNEVEKRLAIEDCFVQDIVGKGEVLYAN
jgi:predicted nucleotidyltransferase